MDIVHFTQVSLSGVISGQRRRNFANIAHHVSEKNMWLLVIASANVDWLLNFLHRQVSKETACVFVIDMFSYQISNFYTEFWGLTCKDTTEIDSSCNFLVSYEKKQTSLRWGVNFYNAWKCLESLRVKEPFENLRHCVVLVKQ